MARGSSCLSGSCPITPAESNLSDFTQQTQDPSPQTQDLQIEKPFFSGRKGGWWWYEKEPVKPKKKKEKKKADTRVLVNLDNYTHRELWNMYPDDFQGLLKVIMKQAVQNPSVKNVKDYLSMQDIAKRKSVVFANVMGYVGQVNPDFSINEKYPVTAPGRRALASMKLSEKDNTIREARDRYALIMFSEEACKFCKAQGGILAYFEDYFGWSMRKIDIDRQPNVAARFNISKVPEIIIVSRKTGDYMPISVGTTSMNELKDRIYRSIRMMDGKIDPKRWYIHDFEKNTSMDPLKVVRRTRENIGTQGVQ